MFCEKCGNQIVDGAAFCGKCGNPIQTAAPAPAEIPAAPVPSYPAQPMAHAPAPVPSYPAQPMAYAPAPTKKRNAPEFFFALVSSLFVFGMFFIPIQITTGSYWSKLIGNKPFVLSGYSLVFNKDVETWWGDFAGPSKAAVIGVLAIAAALLIATIVTFILNKGSKAVSLITFIIDTLFSVAYCICGFVCVSICHPAYHPYTCAYAGLIAFAFLWIGFITLKIVQSSKRRSAHQ